MSSQQRQAIHSIHNKKFWTEFFYLYESLPALWDVNNPLYKNRQVKGDAYDIMVDKLREIEPTADREDVLRKINIFRTNYRRECSRITLSLQEGRQYRSTLWYFDLLNFLQTADTRKERKRKLLDDGIEKSIMRKRRNITTITKHTDTFLVATKKGDIIEYQPHTTHATDIDYDNYEEPNFDYVVEDLSHTLAERKRDSTEMHGALQMQGEDYQDLEDDGDRSQTDYDHEFQNFSMQRNDATSSGNSQNSKNELTTEHMGITSTIGSNVTDEDDGSLIMTDGPVQQYGEYHNEAAPAGTDTVLHENAALAPSQWYIKTTHIPKNLTLPESKQTIQMSSGMNLSTHDAASSTTSKLQDNGLKITSKLVRDVKTNTLNKSNINGQTGLLSESSEIIAKSWAIQYDELTQEQKVLARKAINDILFEGYMGHLAIGSNGRVTNCNSVNYKNQKLSKSPMHDEVESGEVYHQQAATTSSTASNVAVVSKTPDDWLKL